VSHARARWDTCTCAPMDMRVRCKKQHVELFETKDYSGFKRQWAWVLVGEVGLHFWTMQAHLRQRETHNVGTCLVSQAMGDVRYGGTYPFLLTPQKRLAIEYSSRDAPCASTQHVCWHTYAHICVPTGTLWARCKKHRMEHKLFEIFESLRLSCV
jgi:hypothetical protein